MNSLSAMVKEYKNHPSDELRNKIMDFLVSAENPEELDRLRISSVGEWNSYGDTRVKHLYDTVYAVTESFKIGDGYMCYAYKIDLSLYSKKALSAYKENCLHLRDTVPNDEIFNVLAVSAAFDVEDAEICEVVSSKEERSLWYDKVDREVK